MHSSSGDSSLTATAAAAQDDVAQQVWLFDAERSLLDADFADVDDDELSPKKQLDSSADDITPEPVELQLCDLQAGEAALLPPASSMQIGCPVIPTVRWEDIGGLTAVKDEIMDVIELPLKHPEVFTAGVKRRAGVLLYGPPGTGMGVSCQYDHRGQLIQHGWTAMHLLSLISDPTSVTHVS